MPLVPSVPPVPLVPFVPLVAFKCQACGLPVKSAHTEASAEACGARPGSTAGLPPALLPPAILPPAPPAPPLSLALAEPSGSALRAPCATQCCSITFSTRPPGLLISPKSHHLSDLVDLWIWRMGRGVLVRAVPGCVV